MIVPLQDGNLTESFASQVYTSPITANMFSPPDSFGSFSVMMATKELSGISISRLWDHVFADNSPFLVRYHDCRKETDLKVELWKMSDDRSNGSRLVSLTTPCDIPGKGVRPTLLQEAHRFCVVGNQAEGSVLLVYHISSQTPDVPFGKSFRTEAVWKVTSSSMEAEPCSLTILGSCKKMSYMFNGLVQRMAIPRAIKEMTEAYRLMVHMLIKETSGTRSSSTESVTGVLPAEPLALIPEESTEESQSKEVGTSMWFQASVLALGVLVVLLVFLCLNSLRTTSMVVKMLLEEPVSAWAGSGSFLRAGCGAGGGSFCMDGNSRGDERGYDQRRSVRGSESSWASSSFVESYLDSVNLASNNAELQSLRYRFIEQQQEVKGLQSEVRRLRWLVYAQLFGVALGLIVYVWRKAVSAGMEKEARKAE